MMSSDLHSQVPGPVRKLGLSPRDVMFVLFRRRWIILAISLPIILVGSVGLLGRTGTYTAASRVLVEFLKVDQPIWNTSSRSIDFDRELSTRQNIAMSISVADRAAVALVDSLSVIRQVDPKLAELQAGTELRDLLVKGLNVNVVGESNILEFQHTAENPRVALMAVGALRDAFIRYENSGGRNMGAIDYYSEQIDGVRAEIDSLLSLRGEILREGGYVSLEDEQRYTTGSVAEVENLLRKVQVDREQLEAEYAILKSYLDRDPREFPAGVDESRASTLVGWRDQVGKHEDALNSILTVHTADSLPARRQRELLDASLKRLREEEIAYTESVHLSLESSRQREKTLQSQLNELRAANMDLPELYQRVSMLDSDIKSLRDLLDDLQGKWGEVRMSEMADDRVSQVVVLTDPELVTVLAGGKTMVYLAMVIVFALALGLVGAFLQDSLDHRIYVPQDVELNLQLPVFAQRHQDGLRCRRQSTAPPGWAPPVPERTGCRSPVTCSPPHSRSPYRSWRSRGSALRRSSACWRASFFGTIFLIVSFRHLTIPFYVLDPVDRRLPLPVGHPDADPARPLARPHCADLAGHRIHWSSLCRSGGRCEVPTLWICCWWSMASIC